MTSFCAPDVARTAFLPATLIAGAPIRVRLASGVNRVYIILTRRPGVLLTSLEDVRWYGPERASSLAGAASNTLNHKEKNMTGEEMSALVRDVKVTSPTTLSNSFVGETFQICVVTADIYRTLEQFVRMGIGPWKIYTFDDNLIKDLTYRGDKNGHSARLAVAWSGAMWWEVIQPLTGQSIYSEWLEKHGDSIHHVAVDCNGMSYDDRIAEFARRGFAVTQSGRFLGKVPYCYVETEDSTGFGVELVELPENFSLPEPEEWYPGPPPA